MNLKAVLFFYVAAEYADLPWLLPYLHPGNKRYDYGTNFASGGAGALHETNQGLVRVFLST